MNYYNNYLNFYTGKNRKEIFRLFCTFIESLRDEDKEKMESCLSPDCIADISMTGHFEGIENVIEGLSWPGPSMDVKRITINSFIARTHATKGQQCAYTQHLYAINSEKDTFPFVFGGQFMNSYEKISGQWKISHIRYDLMFESGNNSYVRDSWKLMDYSILYGHKPMINPELEAPWIVIPENDEPLSDAEAIFELEYRNNIGMDGGCFNLCHEVFHDNVFLNYSSHQNVNKNYSIASDGDYIGRKNAVNFFKGKQHKEARLQHIVAMAELSINKNTAVAYMIRSEYNRIKNNIYTKETVHTQPLTAIHEIHACKENGTWKMKQMAYYPIMEFMPMDDDCICYDDYICGDAFWKNLKKRVLNQ
mgnify:CR=1 FL=1